MIVGLSLKSIELTQVLAKKIILRVFLCIRLFGNSTRYLRDYFDSFKLCVITMTKAFVVSNDQCVL